MSHVGGHFVLHFLFRFLEQAVGPGVALMILGCVLVLPCGLFLCFCLLSFLYESYTAFRNRNTSKEHDPRSADAGGQGKVSLP